MAASARDLAHHASDLHTLPAPPAAGLPASARTLLATLAERGPLTHQAILIETQLAPRTARWAIQRLRRDGLITARTSLGDARQSHYALKRTEQETRATRPEKSVTGAIRVAW